MKKILLLFTILTIHSTITFSQADTCLSRIKIIKIAETLFDFKVKDSIQIRQIATLESMVRKFELLQTYNAEKLDVKERQIELYKESIINLKDVVYATKTKWYETHTATLIFGFVLGGATIYTSSVIINNIK